MMPRALVPALASLLVTCAGAGFLISQQPSARPGRSALSASPYQDGASTSAFLVTDTGTRYRKSTLRSQVRDRIAEQATVQAVQPTQAGPTAAGLSAAPPTAIPSLVPGSYGPSGGPAVGGSTADGSTSDGSANGDGAPGDGTASTPGDVSPAAEVTPSRSLVGCVLHLTGDVQPEFVDRATYQSEPVYVIVVPGEAWVVGIGCTAARPALITSVRLGAAG